MMFRPLKGLLIVGMTLALLAIGQGRVGEQKVRKSVAIADADDGLRATHDRGSPCTIDSTSYCSG
jgi:hypothetical protein